MQKLILTIMLSMTVTIIYSQSPCPGVATVTYAGKTYNTVQIGTQCWLKENLDVGTMIQGSQNQTNNGILEKYCYNNDPNNCTTNGGLYQWNEAMAYSTTQGSKGICPDGWHIPTKAEFETLAAAVSNNGNSLKASGFGTGAGAGTNASGFNGMLAGYRDPNGSFYYYPYYAYFQSSTIANETEDYYLSLNWYDNKINIFTFKMISGISIRCIKGEGITSVEQEKRLPTEFQLTQNYPNPFNPTTIITFSIPHAVFVTLKVYDLLGRDVTTLVDEYQQPGNFVKTFYGTSLPSGIYFYRLRAGNYSDSKKMLLIK